MATVTGYTAERMKVIEDETVVGGAVNNMGNLILHTRAGANIDAGSLQGPQGIQGIPGLSGGSTTQRDAYYTVPTTVDQQVALANKVPLWYNATTGYIEMYYAVNGSPGLTVPGVSSGYPAGWYPLSYFDKLPRGLQVIKELVAASASSPNTQVVQTIPSFKFLANRWYTIEWTTGVVATAGAPTTVALAQLFSCAVTDNPTDITNMTELMGYNIIFQSNQQTSRVSTVRKIRYSVDTTLQIKATLSGAGSVTLYANAGPTYPAQLTITDAGANGLIL